MWHLPNRHTKVETLFTNTTYVFSQRLNSLSRFRPEQIFTGFPYYTLGYCQSKGLLPSSFTFYVFSLSRKKAESRKFAYFDRLPGGFSFALGRHKAGAMSPGLGSSAWLGICSMIVPPKATWTIVSLLLSSAPLFSLSVLRSLLDLLLSVSKSKKSTIKKAKVELRGCGVLLMAVGVF